MDTPVVVALIALAGSIVTAVFVWRASGRATDVNEQAANLGWVKELRQDAIDTRKEVEQLQEEVRRLRRQLDIVTREADHWIAEHQNMRRHAFRHGMTIGRLRELWGTEPPASSAAR